MNIDFHYYATYSAATLAGFSHEESKEIGYAAAFVDNCNKALIKSLNGPISAASVTTAMELADTSMNLNGIHDLTRIWSSFHFLPGNLYAEVPRRTKVYMNKYRLICGTNSDLLADTINNAKGKGTQAYGVAMHVTADTWAHSYFAGTPSFVINDSDRFFEVCEEDGKEVDKPITFKLTASEDFEKRVYIRSISQSAEDSIMNLGHGRAGHLPDYSFLKYKFMPSWKNYEMIVKDNPSDFYHAFCQMTYALQYLHGDKPSFEKNTYAEDAVAPYKEEIMSIIKKRQTDATADWKALAEKLAGQSVEEFDVKKYQDEYISAPEESKDDTYLGKFFLATMSQKSLVTHRVYNSGNMSLGYSVDYKKDGAAGIKDFAKLLNSSGGKKDE